MFNVCVWISKFLFLFPLTNSNFNSIFNAACDPFRHEEVFHRAV